MNYETDGSGQFAEVRGTNWCYGGSDRGSDRGVRPSIDVREKGSKRKRLNQQPTLKRNVETNA